MLQPINSKYKYVYLGLLLAFALILSYIEFIFNLNLGFPGSKIGLSNFAVLICLVFFEYKDAFLLSITKAILSGMLFGTLTSIFYSLTGAIISCFVMIILFKLKILSIPTISAFGGIFHNIGQLLVALLFIKSSSLLFYLPVLIISGLITGLFIGFIVVILKPYISKVILRSDRI